MFKRSKITLGELEAEIMRVIWGEAESTVRSVLDKIQKKRKVAYTTIMTIMTRLHERGLLGRSVDAGGAYVYFPRETKEKFFSRASGSLITKMLQDYGEVAVAQFADILKSDEFKQAGEWRKKLRKIIK